MSATSRDNDDLKTLQQEAAELEESRNRNGQAETPDADLLLQSDSVKNEQDTDTFDNEVDDLAGKLDSYIKEIEETAMERPALALLTTFALGIIVGHLFTRK